MRLLAASVPVVKCVNLMESGVANLEVSICLRHDEGLSETRAVLWGCCTKGEHRDDDRDDGIVSVVDFRKRGVTQRFRFWHNFIPGVVIFMGTMSTEPSWRSDHLLQQIRIVQYMTWALVTTLREDHSYPSPYKNRPTKAHKFNQIWSTNHRHGTFMDVPRWATMSKTPPLLLTPTLVTNSRSFSSSPLSPSQKSVLVVLLSF